MKALLSMLLCLILSSLTSLSGNEIFKQLTINDGLAHTDANCIVQDSIGLIWVGTYAGLQSYDGYKFQTFDYYPSEHKIFQSHNRIRAMVCTGERLWLGTESGLTCFDLVTHCYIPYFTPKDNTTYDFGSSVTSLFTDLSGEYLWIKNASEIIGAKIVNDTIRPLKWSSEEERLFGKSFSDLQFQGEKIWAVAGQHIVQLGIHQEEITVSQIYETKKLLKSDEMVDHLYFMNGFLYMRTRTGCYRVSVVGGQLHESSVIYTNFHEIDPKIPEYTNGQFIVGKDGTLWCAYLEGVFEVKYPFSETPSVKEYLRNTEGDKLSAQKIRHLLIDRYDNLWVASNSWGVFYRTLSKSFFKNISKADFRKMGFSQNEIVSVTGQENGIIWMIVEYANLFCYDPQTEKLSLVPLPRDNRQALYLQSVEMSHNQRHLYIGTSHGIFIYDTYTKQMVSMQSAYTSDSQKINTSIADFREDEFGRLWVATWGEGLFCINNPLTDPRIEIGLSTQTDPRILSNQITNLCVRGRSVFVCTVNGLNHLQLTDTGKMKTLSSYQADKALGDASMSTNYLASIDFSNDSTCWVGTIGGGLNKVVLHSERNNDYTATCYTIKDGLTSNDCEVVMTDNSGNVWIGGNGMFQLDVPKDKIYTYGFADGLQNNAFKINVSYKALDGTLYMGGLYGLSYFNPHHFTHDANFHTLMLSNLFINNRQIIPNETYDGRIVLNKVLDKTSHLTINYLQNNFTISFAALGYELSEQIMYRYRLKGFREDWTTLRYTNNEIYFSNLPYGTYELEIQLSTDRGYTWHMPGKKMEIDILPPWWLSIPAKVTYVIIIVLVITVAFRQYNKEQNLKKENEIQKILIAQDEERYQTKMQFFMNASHELKTPLTLILLAAEKLINESKPAKECKTILYNVKRMLTLISELVDIRKQDLGIASINLSYLNMSSIVRQLFDEMSPWAENKQVSITYSTDETDIEMDADKEKIGKMILNLFSNAIKYTNEGGCIDISFRRGTKQDISPCYATVHTEGTIPTEDPICILTVKDTGVGISSDSIRLIYERFFQVKGNSQTHLGAGIGLAIVKSIVLQHKGMIIVSSERMKGSEFIVALPICESQKGAGAAGLQLLDVEGFIDEQYSEFTIQEDKDEKAAVPGIDNSELPTLLIVEDNKELQAALNDHLSVSYNIHIADNGREGLEKCLSVFPDIIVSDVMMPEMDGIEMCRLIKNNLSVAYIPLVLLTAKDAVESQIEGYESGADLYISKPFSMRLLEVNLHRLLEQRKQWFKKEVMTVVPAVPDTFVIGQKQEVKEMEETSDVSTEEQRKMTERLKKIIEENIGNPDLSPDQLSSMLGVSRTKLYRDLKRIDGLSLADYVRNVRLEKAAYLLLNSNMNIQEVMNEIGFTNNSHFTRIFKLKYEITPSEYKKK